MAVVGNIIASTIIATHTGNQISSSERRARPWDICVHRNNGPTTAAVQGGCSAQNSHSSPLGAVPHLMQIRLLSKLPQCELWVMLSSIHSIA